jgi:hypothetical protein
MHLRIAAVLVVLSLLAPSAFAEITGTVMNSDGAPIAGARVILRAYETLAERRARLMSEAPEPVTLASTQTDAKGAFTLESPKQAAVALHILANGYGPESGRIERDEEVGAVVMRKGESGRGVITSGDGKPVANTVVAIQYGMYEHVTKTNAEGRYEAPAPKRAMSLVVLHPDYAIDEKGGFNQQPAEADLTRTLTAGTKMTGRVTGPDGQTPVADATVAIDYWPVAKSGEDGTFTIAHAPARWGTLTAGSGGMMAQLPFATADSYTLRLMKVATISGRVTDAKTNVAVAGVLVRPAIQGMNRDAFAVETDAKGTYSAVVPPSSLMLYTFHPGYEPANADVTIAAGQQVTRDLTIPRLARVSGTVIDEEKRPVVAASVASVELGAPMGDAPGRMMRSKDTVVSGPDGRFSTRVVPDEPLLITATKRGFPSATSERFRIAAGDRKTGLVLTIPRGIAVAGRVTDGKGEPLSGVSVVATESEPGGMPMMFGGAEAEEDVVRTASDGSFTLRLEEGSYDFNFRREGYAPRIVRAHGVSRAAGAPLVTTMEPATEISGRVLRGGSGVAGVNVNAFTSGVNATAVTAPDGSFTLSGLAPGSLRVMLWKGDEFIQDARTLTAPSRDVVIEIPGGGRVTGRVVDKSSGKPLTSFQAGVSSSRSGTMMMGSVQMREFSSEDGSFTLESVPAGSLSLVASAPGYTMARLNVTVEEGKTLSDVELPLDVGVRLTGRVTGPDGTALGDVTVRVEPSPTRGFSMRTAESTSITDANGEYSLEALPPGDETIAFTHATYVAARKQVTLKGREAKLDVQLTGGQRVTGTVVTEAGAPVPGARVTADGPGMRMASADTNASGMFELESLPPGRYRFTAFKTGAGRGSVEDVDVASNQQVRITVQEGATIYGRIIGLPPEELAATTVAAHAGRSYVTASVDATGSYRLEGAPTGTVMVSAQVEADDIVWQRTSPVRTVEVAPGASQNVDLTFRTDIVIRGRVTRDGSPLQGGSVMFIPRGATRAQTYASTSTDQQGMYSLSGAEEGEYSVQVLDVHRASPYATPYTVRGSATFDIEYRTGSIRGTVMDAASSEPLANASIQIRTAVQNDSFLMPRGAATDATGAFVLDFIPPGEYFVTSSKDGYGSDLRELTVTERGEELQVKLSRNDGVLLKMTDARSGQPVSAMVWVYDAQNRVVYEPSYMFGRGTDTGEVKLPLAPGSYTAAVMANGYASVNLRIQSPSAARVIALSPGGAIHVKSKHTERRRIRLIDASGLPYQRFSNPLPWRELLPRPGTTELRAMAPGTYTLQLLGDGENVVDSTRVTVQEGGVAEVEI